MRDSFAPTLAAAQARIAAVRPAAYARTRNALDGAVSGLSPYITHGFVTLADVLGGVAARHALDVQHKFVYELGWRAYFRHVWQHRGEAILHSLHEGPLPDDAYARVLPADIRQGCTGVPVVDEAVRALYATGMLHNHARMWLASYVVHVRKVHWRAGADWLYGHLLDGDLASNHLSWQWVAGTGSHKPYLFNADNVARYAPASWHSSGSVIDTSYEVLDRLARQPAWPPVPQLQSDHDAPPGGSPSRVDPILRAEPPSELGLTTPDAAAVTGRDVWLVHPWSLGALPAGLPADTAVIGVFVANYHRAWPWSERRWHFVGIRMAELAAQRWHGDAAAIGAALKGARTVRSMDEPHLAPWLARWAACEAAPALFPAVDRRCDSFSQWWARTSRGLDSAADLLAVNDGAGMVTPPANEAVTESKPLTVLYDGACPLCRREIGVYRGLQPLRPDAPVCFADVSDAAIALPSALPPGTTREQLLANFHVRGRDGELLSGAQAFLALWAALPGWRWLAWAGRLPGAAWVMERSYRLFLRWRPMLQRWAFRLEQPGPDRPSVHDNAPR